MNEFLRKCLFLPPQSSSFAIDVDSLHYFVILMTFLGAIGVTIVGGWFVFRYGRTKEDKMGVPRPDRARRTPLWAEALMISGLATVFFFWWFLGHRLYVRMRVAPQGAMPIYVTAKQWMWKFAYPQGQQSIAAMYVPLGRPVELRMTARDVIHSFYVPDFRQKQDVIPGRFTTAWFSATKPGRHPIYCAEYCGVGHSIMRGEVIVLSPADFARWLDQAQPEQPLAGPKDLYPPVVTLFGRRELVGMARTGAELAGQFGCLRCHTLDGTPHLGPTWQGLYRSHVPLERGDTVVADDAYLTESMMDPAAKIHRGYKAIMPSYQGVLQAGQTAAILELIHAIATPEQTGGVPRDAPRSQKGLPPLGTAPMPLPPDGGA